MVKYVKAEPRARGVRKKKKRISKTQPAKKSVVPKKVRKPVKRPVSPKKVRKPVLPKKITKKVRKPVKRPVAPKKIRPVKRPVPPKKVRKPIPTKKVRKPVKRPAPPKKVRKPVRRPKAIQKLQAQIAEMAERAAKAEVELSKTLQRVEQLERELTEHRQRIRAAEEERRRRILSREEMDKMLRERQAIFRSIFSDVLRIARNTGQIPSPNYGVGRGAINTTEREGTHTTIQIDRELNLQSKDSILAEVIRETNWMSNRDYPFWLGEINLVGLGEKLFGYQATTLVMDELDVTDAVKESAKWFQVLGVKTTGLQNTYTDVIENLSIMLSEMAGDDSTILYVTYISVMGFKRS